MYTSIIIKINLSYTSEVKYYYIYKLSADAKLHICTGFKISRAANAPPCTCIITAMPAPTKFSN